LKLSTQFRILTLTALLFPSPLLFAKGTAVTPASPAPLNSNIRTGFSLGVGYPYLGLKYFFNEDLGLEARFYPGDGITVYAGRGYWSFVRSGNFSLQAGAEFGQFTFNSMTSDKALRVSGDGQEFGPFVGLDYFMDRQFSVLFDFYMPVMGVQSHAISLGDVEYVAEGGLYFYPF
jgi:hypothetical protein